jgi:hypothetical protein
MIVVESVILLAGAGAVWSINNFLGVFCKNPGNDNITRRFE